MKGYVIEVELTATQIRQIKRLSKRIEQLGAAKVKRLMERRREQRVGVPQDERGSLVPTWS